ncbi:MAG: phenylalanine--tRNA ligase subunit beta [Chloroflexi bacterium]|nr:phenylalanine--tRNA ligase subunit beta [Chloroflexota bacterium]
MRVSLKWLRDYVDIALPAQEVARRLTQAGVEVASIENTAGEWDNVFVGEVKNLAPHPNADRLQVVTVDIGTRTLTVVAGAFNIKIGDRVPVALAGARLVDAHSPEPRVAVLKPTKLRGVMSEGMVCSAMELGVSDDHTGILILEPDAQVGIPLREQLGDTVLVLDVTPNRPDCLSMIGVAREVAALTGQSLRLPRADIDERGKPAGEMIAVEIEAPDLCHRYSASVITGVKMGASPKWMQERLSAAGMRPINNIVDVTNYVMLEWGQPLHAFDYDTIRGRKIVVRRARDGEEIITIDGAPRPLTPDMLVIADVERPVAIAGVMGGADTEVGDTTQSILLESANFDRVANRRTSRALRLPSEASRRFDKGLPEDLTIPALERATQLMHQLANGTVARGIVDAYPIKRKPVEIELTPREVRRVLGVSLSADEIATTLRALEFDVSTKDDVLCVGVPMHRTDVTLPADLVEDLARTMGYENIPTTMLSGRLPEPSFNESLRWESLARSILVGCGLTEIITYSLTSREAMRKLLPGGKVHEDYAHTADPLTSAINTRIHVLDVQPLLVVNPLSSDMECLRTTTLVSLLQTIRDNLRYRDRDVALFEIGRIYLPRDRAEELPDERRIISVGTSQYRSGGEWGTSEEVTFFDLKAVAEALLQRMGLDTYGFLPIDHPTFASGRTAAIVLADQATALSGEAAGQIASDQAVGILGEVNGDVRANFDIGERVYLLALDFEQLTRFATWNREFKPLPKFPPIVQDLAVVVDAEVPAALVRQTILQAGGNIVRCVDLFDVYRGDKIPAGKKSLAYHIVYQVPDRTLTDKEANDRQQHIEKLLAKELGAIVRR